MYPRDLPKARFELYT